MPAGGTRSQPEVIRFGDFEFDLSRQILTRRGIRLKLQKQPAQVLALLIQQAPEVVSREEIRRHIWGESVHVDAGQSINFCIRQIRAALLDAPVDPRFVQTLPREGYRFIAALEGRAQEETASNENVVLQIESVALQEEHGSPPQASFTPAAGKPSSRPFRLIAAASVALIVLSAAVTAWLLKRDAVVTISNISQITNYKDDEIEPSLSPDGRQVAFAWNGEDSRRHIYVTAIGEQRPLRLTHDMAEDSYPTWSPDGKQIAFIRSLADLRSDIILIPSAGGAERVLREIQIGYPVVAAGRIMAWSPDGKWLCFTGALAPSIRHNLFLLSVDTGSIRTLFGNESASIADSSPAFSPDGKWLAFARFFSPYNSNILLQRLTADLKPDGEPLAVSNTEGNPTTPVWLNSGTILFLDRRGERIMQANVGGPARLVYSTKDQLAGLSLSPLGNRLVASRGVRDTDIWTLPLKGLNASGPPERIAYSTADELQPRFSTDGRWLAFRSHRSGASEIWLADSNGENARQLTHLSAWIVGYPRWSADSKYLVFHARVPGEPQIYLLRMQDGVLRQVTRSQPGFVQPSFSSDGKMIYLMQPKGGDHQLYRMPLMGAAPQLLWLGVEAKEAPGRDLLLYAKLEQPGIYARSVKGDREKNAESRLVDDYVSPVGGFEAVNDGIYYVGSTQSGHLRAFRFYSFESNKVVDIAPIPANFSEGLTVAPDRSRLAYTAVESVGYDLVQLDVR